MRRRVYILAFWAVALGLLVTCADESPVIPSYPTAALLPATTDILLGPIDGLTTGWHPAPERFVVPRGVTLTLRCLAPDVATVAWEGAQEISRDFDGSTAVCEANTRSLHSVRVRIEMPARDTGGKERRPSTNSSMTLSCAFTVSDISSQRIRVTNVRVRREPLNVSESESNWERLQWFGRRSVAGVHEPSPDRFITAVETPVWLVANVTPVEFAPLIEWRLGTDSVLGASAEYLTAPEPGKRVLNVGPPQSARSAILETYRVSIQAPPGGFIPQLVHEATSIVLTAQTSPRGYEPYITWLSATRYGSALPVTARGSDFTVFLDDITGPDRTQWYGVRADNAVLSQDVTCPANECSFFALWQNKKNGGAPPQAPANYVSFPGTGTPQGSINWLIEWDNSSDPFNLFESVCGVASCFGDALWDAQKAGIVASCQNEATVIDRVRWAAEAVHDTLVSDSTNVCRHYAWALESVLECMGIDAGLECAFQISKFAGHAWVELTINGTRYLLDAYNEIYVCCQ